ncbi:MAG: nitrate reductase molybdenum cofactor assembly chaperone [Proteobacteria bacterium]|nr:nitrate reductase molybdenum cofactor assembly chaperone [Pseudomonadota bacterium]
MTATYKILSALLSYPSAELQEVAHDLIVALNVECLLTAPHRTAIGALLKDMSGEDLLELQAEYVELFDRTRALSLHLFEHVHRESRDRGQAMVSLRDRYHAAGLDIMANELPDHIPVFLEFLSLQQPAEARAMLAEPLHILAALGERLKKRAGRYAVVFDALVSLAETDPDAAVVAELQMTALDDPNDLVALDRVWEETEVRFGPGDVTQKGSCPKVSSLLANTAPPRDESEALARLAS